MDGQASWKFIDQGFPELASYDETSSGTNEGLLTRVDSFVRSLVTDSEVTLTKFVLNSKETLEFWVIY